MSPFLKTVIAAFLALCAVAVQGFLIWAAHGAFGTVSDLPEYYAVSKLILSGHGADAYSLKAQAETEQAYFPSLNGRVIGFFVPPFALAWIAPIGSVPVEIAPYVWKALLLLAIALSLWLISSLYQLDKKAVFWLVAVSGFSGCLYEALRLDQLAPFLLLAVCVCIWALKKDRPIVAALCLTFLLLKPQEVLPFLVFLLGAKRYRILLTFVAIAAAVTVVGMIEIGGQGLLNYQQLMSNSVENSRFLQSDLAPTLRGQLYRLFPDLKTFSTIASSIVMLGALGVIFYAGRKFRLASGWVEAGLLVAFPLGLVSALYFFDYDLLILLPALVVLMKDQLQDRVPPLILLAIIVGGLIFMLPFSLFIHYDYLMKGGPVNPYFFALLVFAAWLVYFVFKNAREFDLWLE